MLFLRENNNFILSKSKTVDSENLNYVVKSESKRGKNFYVYLFLFFIIVFVGSMFSLRNICLINKKSREIIILQEELKLCKSENIALENEISRRFDLEFVEEEIKRIGEMCFKEVFVIDANLGGTPDRAKKILKM